MSEYSTSTLSGADGPKTLRLHPDAVRAWRNEMSAGINEYLGELQHLEAALASHARPSEAAAAAARFRASEPREPLRHTPAYSEAPATPPSLVAANPPAAAPPASPEEAEFDARLANLKKMLAEKLTSAESKNK